MEILLGIALLIWIGSYVVSNWLVFACIVGFILLVVYLARSSKKTKKKKMLP